MPVMATTGPGGGIKLAAGTVVSGIRRDVMSDPSWMRPSHIPILQPVLHAGMTALVSPADGTTGNVLTVSHDASTSKRGFGSIKAALNGAATNRRVTLPLPTPTEVGIPATKVRAGGTVRFRIKCTDWTKVEHLFIGFTPDNGTNQWSMRIVEFGGISRFGCTDPVYSSRWNNQWRSFALTSRDGNKMGNPAPWGVDEKWFEFDKLYFDVTSTAAVDIHIDEIYSEEWPVGVVTHILDGCYKSARDLMVRDFLPRGWGWGVSANRVDGTGIYPSIADLKAQSDLGADVFCHGHVLTGANIPDPLATDGSTPESAFSPVFYHQRRALLEAGVNPVGMRWHQWLQNRGRLAEGTDVAAALRKFGVDAARADTVDGEFGWNPFLTSINRNMWFNAGPLIPRNGRFNRPHMGTNRNRAANRDDYSFFDGTNFTVRKELEYVGLAGLHLTTYDHEILDGGYGNYDDTLTAYRDRVAHMDELERAGKIVVLKPTEVEQLTHWRTGDDWFVDWQGECVYRHDPTKIAF
jgi:hypothetical protein